MEAFHNVFHVTKIRKCITDQDIIIPEILADMGTNLTFETRPVRIVDRMEKATRKKTIQMIKVISDYNGQKETTWETEARMKADYPQWFVQFATEEILGLDSRRIHRKWGRVIASSILDRIVGMGHGSGKHTSRL